jgi:hypothetical protein
MHNFVTAKFCHQINQANCICIHFPGHDFVQAGGPVVILFPIPSLKLKKTKAGMNLTAEFECYILRCVDISFTILNMEVAKCFYI